MLRNLPRPRDLSISKCLEETSNQAILHEVMLSFTRQIHLLGLGHDTVTCKYHSGLYVFIELHCTCITERYSKLSLST
jgi:hypothetical protein